MEFFEDVGIGQVLVVDNNVVAPAAFRDAVDGKTGGLIKTYAQIGEGQGYDHAVNDGCGEQVLRAYAEEPAWGSCSQPRVSLADGLFEGDTAALDGMAQSALLFAQGDAPVCGEFFRS